MEMGRGDLASSCPRSGTLNDVLVWHARTYVRSIPHLNSANASGPTSRRKSVFRLLAYLRVNESTDLPALTQAFIDFKPKRLRDRATAIGFQGGEALVMTRSSRAYIPRFVNTRLMLRGKQLGPGVLINSRSKN